MGKVVYFLSGTTAGVAFLRTNAVEQTRHRCIALQPERTLISFSLSPSPLSPVCLCMIPGKIQSYAPGRDKRKTRFTRCILDNYIRMILKNDFKKIVNLIIQRNRKDK